LGARSTFINGEEMNRFASSGNLFYSTIFWGSISSNCKVNLSFHGVIGSLSPWYSASSGCRWRRQPPDMEGNCKYIE